MSRRLPRSSNEAWWPAFAAAALTAALAGCGGAAVEAEPGAVEPNPDASPSAAEPMRLGLNRRPAAGDAWTERFERRGVTTHEVIGSSTAPTVRERIDRLEARVSVTAAQSDRDQLRVEVLEHLHQAPGQPPEALPPGTVVEIARQVERAHVTIDGTPASRQTMDWLTDAFPLSLQDPAHDDDVFWGADTPRAIGEPWSPPHAPLEAALGGPVQSATASIEGVEEVDGVGCAVFVAHVVAHTANGEATMDLRYLLPLDPARPMRSWHNELRVVRETARDRWVSVYTRDGTRIPREATP